MNKLNTTTQQLVSQINGEYPLTEENILAFEEYFHSFYTEDENGKVRYDFLTKRGYTKDMFWKGFNVMLSLFKQGVGYWGEGDTFDREWLRDIFLFHFFGVEDIEFTRLTQVLTLGGGK